MLLLRAAALGAALLLLLLSADAWAIPAFARRYETSCQTCHVAFPRLTPFGEAFRRNAYRFPGGGDAMAEKEEPVTLGNEAMRDRWPATVWPGQLPRTTPLSFVVDGKATFGPEPEGHTEVAMAGMAAPEAGHAESALALGGLGGHIGLRSAGSLGDAAAFFASMDVGGHEPIVVERAFAVLTPLGPTALHVRVGRFEPELHGFSIHRSIFNHQLRLTTTPLAQSTFSPEMSATGVELSGVALGRAAWALGAVENTPSSTSTHKDFYARVEAKLGGMRLDGVDAQAGAAAWSERSVSIGLSGWSGQSGLLQSNGMPLHEDAFMRLGADLHATYDNILLDLVVAREDHSQPSTVAGQQQILTQVLAELTWMASAVFIPTARLEGSSIDYGDGLPDQRWLASVLGTVVLRANLLLRVEVGVGADPGHGADLRSASLGFSLAF